jgi:hypothetical protein
MNSTTPDFFPVSEDLYSDVEQAFYGHHERLEMQLSHSRVLIGLLTAVSLAALGTTTFLTSKVGAKPVHVIRINDVGRADALAYFDDSYRPQAPEAHRHPSPSAQQTAECECARCHLCVEVHQTGT